MYLSSTVHAISPEQQRLAGALGAALREDWQTRNELMFPYAEQCPNCGAPKYLYSPCGGQGCVMFWSTVQHFMTLEREVTVPDDDRPGHYVRRVHVGTGDEALSWG